MNLELLSTKFFILIFFCMLCRKFWISYGHPFFSEEYTAIREAENAREQTLSHLKKTLVQTLEESRLNDLKILKLKEVFVAWQGKMTLHLQQKKNERFNKMVNYHAQIKNKRTLIKKHEEAKENLEETMCQMRTALTQSYLNELGAHALAVSIAKIADTTKLKNA